MSNSSRLIIARCVAFAFAVGGRSMASESEAAHHAFFESKVRPLLAQRCYGCHSAEAESKGKLKGGLRVDSLGGLLKGGDTGPALVPGELDKSPIIEAVSYKNDDLAMPPKGKLSEAEIKVFREWVAVGAPWPGVNAEDLAPVPESAEPYDWERFRREHWSFRPIVRPAVPATTSSAWSRSEIDQFVLARLEEEGLQPNPPAAKRILVRRAYLDLIGLPPSAEEVHTFLTDETPEAFERLVDKLLESDHYGERWARHWLDVARYSDGLGGFLDGGALPKAWHFRDWVVQALNRDMPYNEFVRRQIAGDLLDGELRDPVGTGFFVVGPTYISDGGDPEAKAQAEAETLSDRVDTFSRAFLGLTAACARCHDHKFDPISIKDYYALAAIFRNSRFGEFPVAPDEEVQIYNQRQKEIQDQNRKINDWLNAEAKRQGKNRNQVEKLLGEEDKSKLKEMREILDQLKKTAPGKYDFAHVLLDGGQSDMHVALRGDLRKKGELVPRRFLEILRKPDAPSYSDGSGREELAESVVDPANPLTARVLVNRVWQWHFGKALVRTPSNFGVLGETPTHPGLLDWLAADFMESGWSLKRLHRKILLSATWQMSSAFDESKFERDGDNRFLWRNNPRKLEAEVWRDALLTVTGELDRSIGGPPVREILDSPRRTLYATVSRNGDRLVSDEFLRLFDFPAPRSTSAGRVVSTVPQQYLFMMNSPFMKARANALGQSLVGSSGTVEEKVRSAYERLYSRPPQTEELALGMDWMGSEEGSVQLWSQYAQVLLSAHELFQIQ